MGRGLCPPSWELSSQLLWMVPAMKPLLQDTLDVEGPHDSKSLHKSGVMSLGAGNPVPGLTWGAHCAPSQQLGKHLGLYYSQWPAQPSKLSPRSSEHSPLLFQPFPSHLRVFPALLWALPSSLWVLPFSLQMFPLPLGALPQYLSY